MLTLGKFSWLVAEENGWWFKLLISQVSPDQNLEAQIFPEPWTYVRCQVNCLSNELWSVVAVIDDKNIFFWLALSTTPKWKGLNLSVSLVHFCVCASLTEHFQVAKVFFPFALEWYSSATHLLGDIHLDTKGNTKCSNSLLALSKLQVTTGSRWKVTRSSFFGQCPVRAKSIDEIIPWISSCPIATLAFVSHGDSDDRERERERGLK